MKLSIIKYKDHEIDLLITGTYLVKRNKTALYLADSLRDAKNYIDRQITSNH